MALWAVRVPIAVASQRRGDFSSSGTTTFGFPETPVQIGSLRITTACEQGNESGNSVIAFGEARVDSRSAPQAVAAVVELVDRVLQLVSLKSGVPLVTNPFDVEVVQVEEEKARVTVEDAVGVIRVEIGEQIRWKEHFEIKVLPVPQWFEEVDRALQAVPQEGAAARALRFAWLGLRAQDPGVRFLLFWVALECVMPGRGRGILSLRQAECLVRQLELRTLTLGPEAQAKLRRYLVDQLMRFSGEALANLWCREISAFVSDVNVAELRELHKWRSKLVHAGAVSHDRAELERRVGRLQAIVTAVLKGKIGLS
ncbi:MAG: hypothetical protein AB1543_04180 [Candidatus Bipolaricaulota bacterium]